MWTEFAAKVFHPRFGSESGKELRVRGRFLSTYSKVSLDNESNRKMSRLFGKFLVASFGHVS